MVIGSLKVDEISSVMGGESVVCSIPRSNNLDSPNITHLLEIIHANVQIDPVIADLENVGDVGVSLLRLRPGVRHDGLNQISPKLWKDLAAQPKCVDLWHDVEHTNSIYLLSDKERQRSKDVRLVQGETVACREPNHPIGEAAVGIEHQRGQICEIVSESHLLVGMPIAEVGAVVGIDENVATGWQAHGGDVEVGGF